MARKPINTPIRTPAVKSTEIRNSPLPRPTMPASAQSAQSKKQITREMIAKRAYEIFLSGKGGSEQDNWLRAERELRGS